MPRARLGSVGSSHERWPSNLMLFGVYKIKWAGDSTTYYPSNYVTLPAMHLTITGLRNGEGQNYV